MSEQTTYINGVFANEFKFNDGGTILKLSIPADKIDGLCEQLRQNVDNGWVKLKIQRMRSPKVSDKTGKTIATHSISVDNWKPKQEADNNPWA